MRDIKSTSVHVKKVLERVDTFDSVEAALAEIDRLLKTDKAELISFVNAHALNVAAVDSEFRAHLLASSLLLRDGVGVEFMLKALSENHGANLNGTDLIPAILERNKSATLAVIGTEEPYLSRGIAELHSRGINISASIDGFRDDAEYLEWVKTNHDIDIILLAMGMPKQERVANQLKANGLTSALIINGGAIIDFLGGKVSRAPMWMRRLRLEWLFRLLKEPKRMWRRYIAGGMISALYLWQLKKHGR